MNLENDQTFRKEASIFREKDVEIAKSAQIQSTVIGSKTIINDGAMIANSVIGRNCTIKAGAVIQDSVLWNNIVVESGVKLHQAIVAEENTINADYNIAGKVVLPRKTSIPSGSTLGGNNIFTVYGNEAKPDINEDQDSDSDEQDLISIRTTLPNSN
jgi:ADP-glucose pyrophosphorylase